MTDIFSFWERAPLHSYIHPDDEPILARVPHGFNLNCLPGPWMGPLRTAKVVFLYLAPGLAKDFDETFSASAAGREFSERLLNGDEPLPAESLHPPAYKWWHRRTATIIRANNIASKLAIADIAPYHSAGFRDGPLLAALPSCRAMLEWAHTTLFPQALRGEKMVVCLRSPHYWGLTAGWSEGALFAPRTTRGGHMVHGAIRKKIEKELNERLASV